MTLPVPLTAPSSNEAVELPAVCDVAILGAGPAGLATALALARMTPHRHAVLIDTGQRPLALSLEVLDASGRTALDDLGLATAFTASSPPAARGALAAWGDSSLLPPPPELFPKTAGWRVERRAFEGFLRAAAFRRGIRPAATSRLIDVSRAGPGFRLDLDSGSCGQQLEARFLVDATGRQALLAHRLGARKVRFDRLVGAFVHLSSAAAAFNRADVLIGAHPEGFWYAAPCPAGGAVCAFMTDADIARRLAIGEAVGWRRLLEASECRQWLGEKGPEEDRLDPPAIRSLDMHYLDRPIGPGWLAVGDAALTTDPLTASGLARSLTSGVLGGRALADALTGRGTSLKRYERRLENERDDLLERRRRLYTRAGQAAAATFWQRRREHLTIGPDHLLTFVDSPANRARVEGFGMHLTAAQLLRLCHLCAAPRLVQAVSRAFLGSCENPPPERRVLLALSDLVGRGLFAAE